MIRPAPAASRNTGGVPPVSGKSSACSAASTFVGGLCAASGGAIRLCCSYFAATRATGPRGIGTGVLSRTCVLIAALSTFGRLRTPSLLPPGTSALRVRPSSEGLAGKRYEERQQDD